MHTIKLAAESNHLRRGAAAAALVAAALLHLFITAEYLQEKLYIGLLFGLSVPTCLGAAIWLWKTDDRRAWALGTLLSVGMIAGFLASRTVGLPGFDESGEWAHWTEGFPALAAELGFVALAAKTLLTRSAESAELPTRTEQRVMASR